MKYQVRWIKDPYTGKDYPNGHCWEHNISDVNRAFQSKCEAERRFPNGECAVEEVE